MSRMMSWIFWTLGMAVDELAHVLVTSGKVDEETSAAGAHVRRDELLDLRSGPLGLFPSVANMAGGRAPFAALDLRLVEFRQGRLDQLLRGWRRESEGLLQCLSILLE